MLGGSKPHEIIIALATLVTAVVGAVSGIAALRKSSEAATTAQKAGSVATATSIELRQRERTAASVPPSGASTFVVQLASYLARNCSTAQDEIDSYRDAFSPRPALWRASAGKYVVVGIPAQNQSQAEGLRTKAVQLATDNRFSANDLTNAKVRANPGWEPLASCADVKDGD